MTAQEVLMPDKTRERSPCLGKGITAKGASVILKGE